MSASDSPGGAPQVPGGDEEKKNPDQQSSKDVVSHESFKKVLDEKKSLAARLAAFEAKEKEQLEKNGEFQKLYEEAKAKLAEVETQRKSERATFAYQTVASQFKAEAAKLGCKRLDALEKLVDLDELAAHVGSNYVVEDKALKSFVEKAQKDHDYLFAKEAPGFRDAPPANNPASAKSWQEEIKGAKTQAQLDSILRKHGLA